MNSTSNFVLLCYTESSNQSEQLASASTSLTFTGQLPDSVTEVLSKPSTSSGIESVAEQLSVDLAKQEDISIDNAHTSQPEDVTPSSPAITSTAMSAMTTASPTVTTCTTTSVIATTCSTRTSTTSACSVTTSSKTAISSSNGILKTSSAKPGIFQHHPHLPIYISYLLTLIFSEFLP